MMIEEYSRINVFNAIRSHQIVGMTTTGSSKFHEILKDVGPSIVIVEEAALVLEALLSPKIKHLILIDDHKQMRAFSRNLPKSCEIDKSLFERLILNGYPSVMLNTQHRAVPSISWLLELFYTEKIHDAPEVNKDQCSIRGLKHNIFFLNHTAQEETYDVTSKINKHEIAFVTKLCLFLVLNGYSESEITVLTTYLGQSKELNKLIKKAKLQNLRVSTVDNFQGEENKIIILSLVASKKLGFLNSPNRMCVAFSRAKVGFFCIGNLEFLASKDETWSNIIKRAKDREIFGDSLPLICKSEHAENDINAIKDTDFDERPDGGCKAKCIFRINSKCGLYCNRQ